MTSRGVRSAPTRISALTLPVALACGLLMTASTMAWPRNARAQGTAPADDSERANKASPPSGPDVSPGSPDGGVMTPLPGPPRPNEPPPKLETAPFTNQAPLQSASLIETIVVQMNPRLFAEDLRMRYAHRLYDSNSKALENNFVAGTAGVTFSGGILRPVIAVDVQPMSILTLGAAYNPTYYWNSFGLGQSYPSPNSDYGSGLFKQPNDGPGGKYAFYVHQLTLSGSLQARVGSVVMRNAARATLASASLHDGDRLFYDPGYDTIVYKNGWVAQNDTDLGYEVPKTVVVGARHSLVLAVYPDGAFLPGEAHHNPNTPTSRVGPFASYTLFADRGGLFDTAKLTLIAQWYIEHRFRTGQSISGAVPLAALAFTVSSEFLAR